MAVTDTEIINWTADYTGQDRNTPRLNDPGAGELDDQIRNIKSVIRAESLSKEWERWNLTPTYVSSTSFTLLGDQTGVAYAGRAVKCIQSPDSTAYGVIKTATYTTLTTVTLDMVSGSLTANLNSGEVQFGPAVRPHYYRWGLAVIDDSCSVAVSLSNANGVAAETMQTDSAITGTTTANSSATITGSGTQFLSQLRVGDQIALSSAPANFSRVVQIASNTSLTVASVLGNGTSQTITRRRYSDYKVLVTARAIASGGGAPSGGAFRFNVDAKTDSGFVIYCNPGSIPSGSAVTVNWLLMRT